MIRTLGMIAVAGFVVSVLTISAAVGITGPNAIAHGAWSWGPFGWNSVHGRIDGRWSDDGPQKTREIAWTGGDGLTVDLPADVRYVQAAGPAKVTVTGPQAAVDAVDLKDGRIAYPDDDPGRPELTVTVSAPAVTRFVMQGSGKLAIAGYRQASLDIQIEGSTDVQATGEADSVKLSISGSGDADLAALKTKSAKIDIEGSGDAVLAPSDAADIDLSGSGDATLLTHPARLQTNASGSGRVRQSGGEPASAARSD